MIRVVLVDDHGIVRQGVRYLLEDQPDIMVVGDFEAGAAALEFVQRMRPDVLVADLVMPGLSGLDLIEMVSQLAPNTRVVVLSMHSNVAHIAESLRKGAMGYVVKQADIGDLVAAVRAVAVGRRHLGTGIDQADVDKYLRQSLAVRIDPLDTLSPRERQVLELVAQGLTNAEIAQRLAVGRRTVETHRAHMMSKLGLDSQADVIRFALRRGLLESEL